MPDRMLRERFQTFVFLVVLVFSLQLTASEKIPTEEEPVDSEPEKEPVVSDESTGEAEEYEPEKEPIEPDESEIDPIESEFEKEPTGSDPEEEPPQCSQTSKTQTSTDSDDDDDGDDGDDNDQPPQEEAPCVPALEEEPTDEEADDAEQTLSLDESDDDVSSTSTLARTGT